MGTAKAVETGRISPDEYRRLEEIEGPGKDGEREEVPRRRHYRHPTDPTLTWCGVGDRKKPTYFGIEVVGASKITCPDCLHLFIEKGPKWWWEIHRMWYGTECRGRDHRGCR